MLEPESPDKVTLQNCDREPIHIPGSIQPTGSLLAFDASGTLVFWSANVAELLGVTPTVGLSAADLDLGSECRALLLGCLKQMRSGDVPSEAIEISRGTRDFDLVVHAYQGRVIAEFEHRQAPAEDNAAFALKAHRAIERVKRQRTVDDLLASVVQDVRSLTGFDRVMAYRFRHDDSGDVVAEDRRADLEEFNGRRYPASDIPAQARRLYAINTLRLISEVGYTPVPLRGWADSSLDLSHSVLRSVSPIHVEYLQNMGVAASMSLSILVEGRLWGMIACHHMAPRQVPYATRMACDVLAQVVAANIQAIEGRGKAHRIETAALVRTRLAETLLQEDDGLRAIEKHAGDLLSSLGGEALIVTQFGKFFSLGEVKKDLALEIVESVAAETSSIVQRTRREEWDPALRESVGPWVGMLALRFDPSSQGSLIVLRREQIETVRWGGKPEKLVRVGPLGPRLTPRGSFAEWQEIVRGCAEPWDETYLSIARLLFGEMQRVVNGRYAETERTRKLLMAMLGHDLRDPLQSITMAATVMDRVAPQQSLAQRIKASSTRMQRLITLVMDVSRIESGKGLGLALAETDLAGVMADIVEEARIAHPGTEYRLEAPLALQAKVDRDRIGQLASNLISNARHHGLMGRPVLIGLRSSDTDAVIEVRNESPPIESAIEANLFAAFKTMSRRNDRNPTGLGLGLHIAQAIVGEHGGTLTYRYDAPHVVFTARFPLKTA